MSFPRIHESWSNPFSATYGYDVIPTYTRELVIYQFEYTVTDCHSHVYTRVGKAACVFGFTRMSTSYMYES